MPRSRAAFTLVELMISIALALLLILGVNQVFTYTTSAVGAGEAINSGLRTGRAVQGTLAADFDGIVGSGSGPADAGCMIISSRASYGYRNAQDLAGEGKISGSLAGYPANNAAYLDYNNDGVFGDPSVPGEVVYPSTYNARHHRLDCLSFFSRGTFHRQTGNPGTFVSNMASNEAWIWYGHLWLPDNSNTFSTGSNPPVTFPLAGNDSTGSVVTQSSNPNNYFSNQLVLGRMGTLLVEKSPTFPNQIVDKTGQPQWFIDRAGGPIAASLSPLAGASTADLAAAATTPTDPGSGTYAAELAGGRLDLASTSINNYRQRLAGFILANPGLTWWQNLVDGTAQRFQASPFVSKPMTAGDMAHASPIFVTGCSQFIVEYAGDFLTQDNDPTHLSRVPTGAGVTGHAKYGDVTGPGTDGQVDYYIVNGSKQIAWYGLPRTTSGSSGIGVANGDVVPLRDRFQTMYFETSLLPPPYTALPMPPGVAAAAAAAGYPTFEKSGPAYNNSATGYAGPAGVSVAEALTGYTCAFGPNDPFRPQLIRITMTVEDPSGRLPEGQTYQYVFQVP